MKQKIKILNFKFVNQIKSIKKPCLQATILILDTNQTTQRTFGIPKYLNEKHSVFNNFSKILRVHNLNNSILKCKESLVNIFKEASKDKILLAECGDSKNGDYVNINSLIREIANE